MQMFYLFVAVAHALTDGKEATVVGNQTEVNSPKNQKYACVNAK